MKKNILYKSFINLLLLTFLCPFIHNIVGQIPANVLNKNKTLLPNGWSLTPAGRSLPLGDLPLNIQISPSKKLLAVTNNGQSNHTIQLFNVASEKLLDQISIDKSWYGLQFSNDNKRLYVSGGNDNKIVIFSVLDNKLKVSDSLILGKSWPKEKISPAGIAVNGNNTLYTVTREDSALYIVDLKSKKTIKKVKLGHEAYGCILSPDKKELYVSLWGGDKIVVLNTITNTVDAAIATESHPNELILNKAGNLLLVANANDNSVSVIDVKKRKVIETMKTSLFPSRLTGSTTNGLALSPDQKTLYIANADNNCLAVFDFSIPGKSKSKGFIPTGWYPTCVRTVGKKIFVANGKGLSSQPNPKGPQPISKTDDSNVHIGATAKSEVQYIGGLFKGTLSILDQPTDSALEFYSKKVYDNVPVQEQVDSKASVRNNPIPRKKVDVSPIKYVFYVIKENRTYDQVFGDIKAGNGDSSLCIFPERITPNHHALAREFVLLDNFYVDAEVSADGHNWSTAAYSTDFVEKTWVISYGKRGGNYDFEGSRKIAYPRDGYIWDYCKRAGVSYRTYGEFADKGKANMEVLEGHFAPNFPGYNLDIKDVDRINIWKEDFDSLLLANSIPQFNSIRIGNDHTSGQKKGKISPTAAVADNDLALGMLVQHISSSSIWKESAIFVLEDDAQNGPDHVDAHRSPALVISPYTKRNTVVHPMYSTSGMLRTMELILGLPPMSQYDSLAKPFYECFTMEHDFKKYELKASNVNLEERNVAQNKSAERSEQWDFSVEDAAPDIDLNEVIWKSVKGEDSEMPAPKRSAFVKYEEKEKEKEE